MTLRVPGEGEVLSEVSQLLIEHLSPAKVVRFWASWQAGRNQYLAWRDDRFAAETVTTLYEKVLAYQDALPGDSRVVKLSDDLMTSTGTNAFLQQAHRNNWQQYLATLRPGAQPGWDICVLTASDERQAEMYRRQLDWRREAGLSPPACSSWCCPIAGPAHRVGRRNAECAGAGGRAVAESAVGRLDTLQRILLIHSGGDSNACPIVPPPASFCPVPRVCPMAVPPPSSTSS